MLSAIRKHSSLTRAAKELRISYRHLWMTVRNLEEAANEKLVETSHGGTGGGGKAELTETGMKLLREYDRISRGIRRTTSEEGFWEALGIKISTRNRLKGVVKSVSSDRVASKVVIEVAAPSRITALITREAVDDLQLAAGDRVEALIKATEVMIAKKS